MTPTAPRRILITGSRGLVGSALIRRLETEGWSVTCLVRPGRGAAPPAASSQPGRRFALWDPEGGILEPAPLEGQDAVIHLAGENIGAGRWTRARKERIWQSRVPATGLLCRRLAALASPPGIFIQASATGYFGDRGTEPLTEASPPGTGFLAELTQAWEEAARPATEAGVRTVAARLGVVLNAGGGALPRLLPPFRLGLGARLGSGRQIMSWIALEDAIGALVHLMACSDLAGPVHVTSPEPVTNAEFTRILGRVLRRPALLALPRSFLRLALGLMAEETLLCSQRVLPERLLASGYRFRFPGLEEALRHELRGDGGRPGWAGR
jgi:uncharacterized protein